MRSRTPFALGAAALLIAALGAPATAQEPMLEVVADGLNAPRGIALADDGSIYVAEAGTAGETCLDAAGPDGGPTCFGPSGAIALISAGSVERVVEGLISAGSGPEVGGASDVALADDGSLYIIMNLGDDPAARADTLQDLTNAGWLLKATADGSVEPVADVAAFESANDPDAAMGGEVDSNPYAIEIVDDGIAVADAGANALLKVADDRSVSLIAVIPFSMHELTAEELAAMGPPPDGEGGPPPEGEASPEGEALPEGAPEGSLPVQSVPTSVVLGPDRALYVGQLTGFPFPVGEASVWRVADGEEPTPYATGFTNIMGLDFGPDGTLYVAEIVHGGLMSVFAGDAPPIGAVLSVAPGGGDPTLVATGEQLMGLGGLAVGDDGSVYVTTGTIMGPGAGALVKITP